ncbi:MAG: hypothetical protein N3J91_09010 [Verrucomicrobiae bacterium]|nr:hypothetical protein [Verrucomicrobiae bacterium]
MSVGNNGKTLLALTKDLMLRWEETRNYWRDAKSEEFERRFLAELMTGVDKSAEVFEHLDKLMQHVRHDCE